MNCIVVPIYKEFEELIPNELISITQLYSVLGKHPIFLFGPEKIDWNKYQAHACSYKVDVHIEKFNNSHFLSIDGYNTLVMSPKFYKAFLRYEYLLIHQTDAYVFKDELDYWCSRGFDYIGAPWFEGWHFPEKNAKFIGVGNGGFSLRNVKAHLRVLNSFSYIIQPSELIKRLKNNFSFKGLIRLGADLTIRNNTHHFFNNWPENEDYFFGVIASNKFKWFSVPDMKTALRFSIEVKPEDYILSEQDLPFGCHGWWRYNLNFWLEYITKSNPDLQLLAE